MPPILFIHGAFATSNVWGKIAPVFEKEGFATYVHTLAADLRVKTNPSPQLARLTLADYANELLSVIKDIEAKHGMKPILIGHSMGGLLAQYLATLNVCSAAILITPAPPKDCIIKSPVILFTFLNIVLANNADKSYKTWRIGNDWGVFNLVPKHERAALYEEFVFEAGHALHNLAYPEQDLNQIGIIDENLIKCPILVIGAKEDRGTLLACHRKMANKYSRIGGEYIEYENAAHMIICEPIAPKLANDLIAWVKGLGR